MRSAASESLPLADGAADLVVAFMSLQDIDALEVAVAECARVLRRGGKLCAAIVHPINSAGEFEGQAADSPFSIRGSYLEERRYSQSLERAGLRMTMHSTHRPLESYSCAFEAAGLLIEAIREPPALDIAGAMPERSRRWPACRSSCTCAR